MCNKLSDTTESPRSSCQCEPFISCCWKLPIFHPYGPTRIVWDTFILCALLYTSLEIPLTIAFELTLTLSNTLGIIAFSIDMLLLLDVALNFRTAYFDKYDRLRLILDPLMITKRYLRGWFLLDFLTSFPFEFILHGRTNFVYFKILRIFRLVRIFKILRVLRVVKLFDGLTRQLVVTELIITLKLFKIMCGMIMAAHYFACIWWFVGVQNYDPHHIATVNQNGVYDYNSWIESVGLTPHDDLFVKYSYSWYWAIVTMFTTGYGDVVAHSVSEQWVCSCCIIAGSCFFAYLVGTLTALVAEGDRKRAYEIDKVEEAQTFCSHYRFDRELTRKVLTHIRYFCHYNFVFDAEEILTSLPPFLQNDIHLHIAKRTLSSLDLFEDLPSEIVGQIALRMYSISCNVGQRLFNKNDIAKCLYIQRTGRAVLIESNRILNRGDVIGENAIIYGKRKYSVECQTWAEFFVLNVSDIKQIFYRNFKPNRFKKEWKKLRDITRSQLRSNQNRKCFFRDSLLNIAIHDGDDTPRGSSVHELSHQGASVRSELFDKWILKKHKSDSDNEEHEVSLKEEDESKPPMRKQVSKPSFNSSKSQRTQPTLIEKLSGFSNFGIRQNSERRNEKVLSYSNNINYTSLQPAGGVQVKDRSSILQYNGPFSDSNDDWLDYEESVSSDDHKIDKLTESIIDSAFHIKSKKRFGGGSSTMKSKFGAKKNKRNFKKSKTKMSNQAKKQHKITVNSSSSTSGVGSGSSSSSMSSIEGEFVLEQDDEIEDDIDMDDVHSPLHIAHQMLIQHPLSTVQETNANARPTPQIQLSLTNPDITEANT
eukprot:229099_1